VKTKLLEIRDEGTCILAIAIQMLATIPGMDEAAPIEVQDWFLHRRSGYPRDGSSIMLMCLSDATATNDLCEWGSRGMGMRTMPNAHKFIIEHFDELKDGDVVDVQVILGEAKEPKRSERFNDTTMRRSKPYIRDETAYPHEPDVFTMAEYWEKNSQ